MRGREWLVRVGGRGCTKVRIGRYRGEEGTWGARSRGPMRCERRRRETKKSALTSSG